jgi:hypothetical protein
VCFPPFREYLRKTRNFMEMFLYGSKEWATLATEKKRLETMKRWCFRGLVTTKWAERITNEEVLRRGKEKRNIMNMKKKSQIYLANFETQQPTKAVLEGETTGKSYIGRPRMEYIGQIMKEVMTISFPGMKKLAENGEDWSAAIHQSLD